MKFDRQKKLPDYARSGIPEAWILNLNERHLEVYRQPDGEQYLQVQVVKPENLIAPLFAIVRLESQWWQQKSNPKSDTQEHRPGSEEGNVCADGVLALDSET